MARDKHACFPYLLLAGLSALVILLTPAKWAHAQEKIIVDADLSYFSDDHEAIAMFAELHRKGKISLMGISLVSGNAWLETIHRDATKVLAAQGLEDSIPLVPGSVFPLVRQQKTYEGEKRLYSAIYGGAMRLERNFETPSSSAAPHPKDQEHAVDYIIRSVLENPGEISFVALGPLTNLALAIRREPQVSALLKQVIYMGGTVHASGNVTPSAEFNFWFDPEAAAIVLRENIKHTLVPLDATDKILLRKEQYDLFLSNHQNKHYMVDEFLIPKFAEKFEKNPNYALPVWDTLVPAILSGDDHLIVKSAEYFVDVDTTEGPSYGRLIAYPTSHPDSSRVNNLRTATIILELDETRFWQIYEQLVFAKF